MTDELEIFVDVDFIDAPCRVGCLSVTNMQKNLHLSKSISDSNWSQF